MDIRICTTTEELARYSAWVQTHPQGSLWQSLEWKRYQETLGREVRVYVVDLGTGDWGLGTPNIAASALVVIDRTMGGFSTWDVPRGPLEAASCERSALSSLLEYIVEDASKDKCLTIYLSSLSPLAARVSQLVASSRHEQPEATRVIDLTKPEEEILAQMHPKGRYNIKVAQKNGVHVEESRDVDAFYSLLQQTAERDGFNLLPLKAYKAFLECLPGSFLLMAFETSQKPIAGLLGTILNGTGLYYYGASDYASRSLMAPYALQWEAMRLCKARGCTTYDFLGIVPPAPLTLTLSPSDRVIRAGRGERELPHPWAGVSSFKEKFGGTVVTYPPEQQIVLRPWLWKMLQWKRKIVG